MKKILATVLAAALTLSNVSVLAKVDVEKTEFISENFSDGYSKWLTNSNVKITDDWFTTKDYTDEKGNVILEKALYIGSNDYGEDINNAGFGRIYRMFDDEKTIGAGESFTIEFDMIADNDTRASLNLIAADRTTSLSTQYSTIMFMYPEIEGKNNGKGMNTVFHSTNQTSSTAGNFGNMYSGVKVTRNEKNHIKIDYTLNSDLSENTKDSLTITITNSDGTTAATKEMDFRNSNDIGPKLNGVKGIIFHKDRKTNGGNSGNLYIDNFEVYQATDSSEPEIVENGVKFATLSGSTTDSTAVPEAALGMTIDFDSALKSVAEGAVKVTYGNGKTLPVTVSSAGQVMNVVFDESLVGGMTYTVKIDASKVVGTSGNNMPADDSFTFTVKGETISGAVVKDGKIYQYYLQDDFSDGYGKWQTNSNKPLTEDWFTTKDYTNEDTGDVILNKAMYIGSNDAGDDPQNNSAYGRIYKIFDDDKIIGADEKFTIEFDIVVDDFTDMSLNLIAGDQTEALSSAYSRIIYMMTKASASANSKNVTDVFHSTSQTASSAGAFANRYNGVTLTRNEKNHVKIDYAVNSDLSADTKDNITVTVENSSGTTSASAELDFRKSSDNAPKLNGIKGILFDKIRNPSTGNSGEMYIDNVEVYKSFKDVTPDVESAVFTFSDDATEKNPKTVEADVTNIELNFNTEMKNVNAFFDFVDSQGNAVNYTTNLRDSGAVMSIDLPDMLKANETYTMTIGAGAQGKNGKGLATDYVYTFKTNAAGGVVVENMAVNETITSGGALKISTSLDLTRTATETMKYSLFLIAFGENDEFITAAHKAITLSDYGNNTFMKDIEIADPDSVKKVEAILCTFPGYKVVESKTIER